MEVLAVAGGAFLTVAFESLFAKLEFTKSLDLQKQVLINLQNWERILPNIYGLLEDAEEKYMSDPTNILVKKWLAEIKDLTYDIEDILTEFEVDARKRNLIPKPHQANTSKFIFNPFCLNCFKQGDFISNSQTISKMDDITRRLKYMVDDSKKLKLLKLTTEVRDRYGKGTTRRTMTTSLPEPHVFGRESEKAIIIEKLLNDEGSSKGFSVIPIYGMGGVGKTTLAQLVYNEMKPENFELKAWVCVSDNFDIHSITRTILEEVGGKCDSYNLNLLQQELNNKLSNKKFLLVLDDIWNEDYSQWDSLRKPFFSGAAESKIIITTRSEHVIEIMQGKEKACHLEVLEDEMCLSIFAQHALGVDNFDAHSNLKDIGEKIVKKCKGLPLAAKTLGGLLCDKLDRLSWEHILSSYIWELQENEIGILPALRLSYHHLPSYLKPCFAYCAMFPKDHKFVKNELVFLWITGGPLQQQSEEVGHRYFDELVLRTLFQRFNEDESQYVMHDLIHDLASCVAGETCFNLEHLWEANKKSKVNFEKVRHLSFYRARYDIYEKFQVLKEMKSLRTFIPIGETSFHYIANIVVHDWLPKLRCLKALFLLGYPIRKVPDSIKHLKCLKYLNLSRTLIESLPESVGFLLQLQILLLSGCHRFSKFPTTIGNLIDLHHLDITCTNSLKEMPSGISYLKNLLTLSKFIVGKTNGLMRLCDLKNFSQLQGELSILNLHNVLDVQEAREANLVNIDGLDKLLLEWTSNFDNSRNKSKDEMNVLKWLEPHRNLKSLTISCYGGEKFPSWIGDPFFSKLSYLKLKNCQMCTFLPSLGLLPMLKELIIEGVMKAFVVIGPEFYGHGTFPSLEMLVFRDLLNWKEWTSPTGFGGEFPCLHKLEIKNCPKLTGELPSHLSSLINLVINGCPELRCSSMNLSSLKEMNVEACNVELLKSMNNLTSLINLRIMRIAGLTYLPKSFTVSLIALENLVIYECNELACLWEERSEIANLTHLEKMEIFRCPLLVCLTGKEQGLLPFNLKYLSLSSCGKLESLQDAMMMKIKGFNNSSCNNNTLRLEKFKINNCPSLKSFSGGKLPFTVKSLRIESCENLESLPNGVMTQDDIDNNNLEDLEIRKLPSLNSFEGGQLPASLKNFKLYECQWLESFPERMLQHCMGLQSIEVTSCKNLKSLLTIDWHFINTLVRLYIDDCEVLESIPDFCLSTPNLKELTIRMCKNLNSLPNTMYQLKSLQSMVIKGCPGIECIPEGGLPPNLTDLRLLECENLKSIPNIICDLKSLQSLFIQDASLMVGWSLYNLTSLTSLGIFQSCPPDIVLPSSLSSLFIEDVENLKSILLQSLNSLKFLDIRNSPKLQSLPKEGLPP